MNSMAVPSQPDTAALTRSLVVRSGGDASVAAPGLPSCVLLCSVMRDRWDAWRRGGRCVRAERWRCGRCGVRSRCGRPGGRAAGRRRRWSGRGRRPGRRRRPRAAARRPGRRCRRPVRQQSASAAAAGSVVPNRWPPSSPGRVAFTQPARASSSTGVPARVGAQLRAGRAASARRSSAIRRSRSAAAVLASPDCGTGRPGRRRTPAGSRPTAGRVGATSAAQRPDEPLAPVGRQDSATVAQPAAAPEVGQRGVGAVQQPQLHELVRRDVGDEQGAVELPGRPGRGEGSPPAPTAGTARRPRAARRVRRARPPRRPGRRRWWPGTIRSTTVAGKGDRRRPSSRGPLAGPARPTPATKSRTTRPARRRWPAMLSQDTTLIGAPPARYPRGQSGGRAGRRRCRPARRTPGAARSAATPGPRCPARRCRRAGGSPSRSRSGSPRVTSGSASSVVDPRRRPAACASASTTEPDDPGAGAVRRPVR